MGTKYCDHGLYGTPVAGGTVPTTAEDGNGKGKTAATMATLVVTFAGVSVVGQQITIAGVTFTAVASGASGTNFNVGTDATTSATNLKTAINNNSGSCLKPVGAIAAVSPMRNVLNATSSEAVLTVYTRCAGSDWNSVIETTTLANATITQQWAGGGDGAWGYLINHNYSINWPTVKTACTYGLWSASPCYLGKLVVGDVCKIRAGKTLDFGTYDAHTDFSSGYLGSTSGYITYEIDDGTEWPVDGTSPVILFAKTTTSNYGWNLFNAILYIRIAAKKYANGARSLVFRHTSPGLGSNGNLILYHSNGCIFENIKLEGKSNSVPFFGGTATGGQYRSVSNGCVIEWSGINSSALVTVPGNYYQLAEFNQCEFNALAASTPMTLFYLFSGNSKAQRFTFNACTSSGMVVGGTLNALTNVGYDQYVAIFKDCNFPNITNQGPTTLTGGGSDIQGSRGVYMSSRTGYRDFMMENPGVSFIEWRYQKGRPTLNARLLDGITPWSIFAVTSTTAGVVTRNRPVELPTISKWVPAAGDMAQAVRTIKVNFLLESTLAWNASDVSVFLTYTDSDGNPATKDSFDVLGTALTASAAAWSATAWNAQTWTRYEFNVTTDRVVRADTEICATLRIHSTVTNVTQGIIFDPELIVS